MIPPNFSEAQANLLRDLWHLQDQAEREHLVAEHGDLVNQDLVLLNLLLNNDFLR